MTGLIFKEMYGLVMVIQSITQVKLTLAAKSNQFHLMILPLSYVRHQHVIEMDSRSYSLANLELN